MKKYNVSDLMIEVTRRCNMDCCHCLRGDAQPCNMDLRHVEALFQHVESIATLTLTGGEPSLVPHIIDGIIDLASKHSIHIERFYMATNGMDVSDEFMMSLIKLWNYCANTDEEAGSRLDISNDGYHFYEESYFKKLSMFKFTGKKSREDHDLYDKGLIRTGRFLENYNPDVSGRDHSISHYEIDDDYISGDAQVYLNCNGDILPDCNLSYEQQDSELLKVAHVHDDFDLGDACEAFNDRLNEHYGEVDAFINNNLKKAA